MATAPGRIGRYLVKEVIGAGGFATVYRAHDERLGVDVAVKVLAENHSLDPDVRERFIEEGRRLRRVHSPHVVTVHDLDETERAQPYLVLEWADRGDLAHRVTEARQRGWPPSPGDVLTVARALTAALYVLHRQHLVHRDLAPKNLLLSSTASSPEGRHGRELQGPHALRVLAADETILLADLGLSKDLAVASGLTVAAGTSGFAPPEQRENGGAVDHRADVWAASALVVWLAIDRPPDDAEAWRRELRNRGWPSALSRALARGLAPATDKRHPGIGEWLVDLEGTLQPEPRPAPKRPPPGMASTSPLSPRRRLLLPALLLVALLLGALGGAVVTRGRDGGPEVRIETLADQRQRTSVEDHGITIVVEGPTAISVGEPARLTATIRGTDTWTWVGPDGALVPGVESFELEALTTGLTTVRLLATDDRGQVVEASHRLRVS